MEIYGHMRAIRHAVSEQTITSSVMSVLCLMVHYVAVILDQHITTNVDQSTMHHA